MTIEELEAVEDIRQEIQRLLDADEDTIREAIDGLSNPALTTSEGVPLFPETRRFADKLVRLLRLRLQGEHIVIPRMRV